MARPGDCSKMPRRKLPLFQPRRRARRPRRSHTQLRGQARQVVRYINIVKRVGETYGEIERSCARQQPLQRVAGAHSVACEQRRMRSLCPHEIVAAVVRRSNDYVMCGQGFERVFQNRTRQVWAVAIEGNRASDVAVKCANTEVSPAARPSPFCATTLTSLPANVRQFVYVRRPGT